MFRGPGAAQSGSGSPAGVPRHARQASAISVPGSDVGAPGTCCGMATADAQGQGRVLVLSGDFCRALASLMQQRRHSEALTLLSQVDLQSRAARERQRLAATRMVDDELEAAIAHRDAAREYERRAAEREVTCEFLTAFVEVRCAPLLVPTLHADSTTVQAAVSAALGHEGDVVAVLKNRQRRDALHLALLQQADADAEASQSQARTPFEALLVAALTELCHGALALCCHRVNDDLALSAPRGDSDDAVAGGATAGRMPRPGSQSPLGCSTSAAPNNVSFAAAATAASKEGCSRWEALLASNLATLQTHPAGRAYIKALQDMLLIARHVTAHKVSEEVQAGTSPLMAELLSIYDRICPLPQVVRKPSSAICPLSAVRLDGLPESLRAEHHPGLVFYRPALCLFQQCVSRELPRGLS